MRRRAPFFRRPFLAQSLIRPLASGPQQKLRLAHDLMEAGNYAEAAILFDQLAQVAITRGFFKRAPHLLLQAGYAHFHAGNIPEGKDKILRGLRLFAEQNRWQLLDLVTDRVATELNQFGQPGLSQEIIAFSKSINSSKGENGQTASQVSQGIKTKIPPKCHYCGGTLTPGEIDWLDEYSVECPYCGSAVQENQ